MTYIELVKDIGRDFYKRVRDMKTGTGIITYSAYLNRYSDNCYSVFTNMLTSELITQGKLLSDYEGIKVYIKKGTVGKRGVYIEVEKIYILERYTSEEVPY